MWTRTPLRLRLTLVFGVAMAAVLVGLGTFTYLRLAADLLESVDLGLRPRAQALQQAVTRAPQGSLDGLSGTLIDPDEAFAQVLGTNGDIVDASSAVRKQPILAPDTAAGVADPTFFTLRLGGFDDPVRVLAVPVARNAGRVVLVVGSTLGDLNDDLQRLLVVLFTAGPVAMLLTVALAWILSGAALRPVEQIRREAAAISASEPDRRLPVPRTGDELTRLATTLNAMLDRLQAAMDRERQFVDDASHELRTPLATLRTEIDLALSRPHTIGELESSLGSAREDVERLHRLADDFLVLSRARGGRIPIRRVPTPLPELLARSVAAVAAQGRDRDVTISVDAEEESVDVDPQRVEQAVRNLLENAIHVTPVGGHVRVSSGRSGSTLRLVVDDSGPGFPPEMMAGPLDPFARGSKGAGSLGAGLGLAIVRAVAEAHGGSASVENMPGGGRVTLTLSV